MKVTKKGNLDFLTWFLRSVSRSSAIHAPLWQNSVAFCFKSKNTNIECPNTESFKT